MPDLKSRSVSVPDVGPHATRARRRGEGRLTDNVLNALPKSAQPGAKAALAEIYNAEDRDHAETAVTAFEADYGAKWPKAVAKITDDLDVLLAFYDYPAEHWVHLRTTNPIWVLYLPAWAGRCFPDRSWKRPALTLNAIDAERLSWTRNVGLAA